MTGQRIITAVVLGINSEPEEVAVIRGRAPQVPRSRLVLLVLRVCVSNVLRITRRKQQNLAYTRLSQDTRDVKQVSFRCEKELHTTVGGLLGIRTIEGANVVVKEIQVLQRFRKHKRGHFINELACKDVLDRGKPAL